LSARHFYFFVILIGFLLPGINAHALSVDQMRIGAHPDRTRLVIELSGQTNFRIFLLPDPYRIVIDLPDFSWRAGEIKGNPASGVTGVRHGSVGQGYSRIVLDMKRPVTILSAFALPKDGGWPNRLVVDFAPASEDAFRAQLSKIQGTLTPPTNTATMAAVSSKPPRVYKNAPPAPPPKPQGERPVIVIDAGHGGVDAGTVGKNGVAEKTVTLALAKELKKQLENSGQYKVLLTRSDDTFIKLRERVEFARDHKADLFISLHADSIDKAGVHGSSIYTLSDTASDEQSERLAARENKADMIAGIDLSEEDEEVASILVDLTMRDTMNQSRFFSGKVKNNISSAGLSLLEKPQRSAGFAVLKAPDIPSVLIEAGFMSNKNEARLLSSPEHRGKLATAIKRGIDAYFEQVRKNQRT
jgi:N-acetylmuramoyl-L-alanine amidase